MKPFPSYRGTASFTLVELLVVIGILAILTAAIVIVLNPAELLKQSRDSKRITDMAAVDNALKILLTQTPEVSLGNASTVYVSLGDSSSTCGSYALPTLPSGWQYRCATSANLIKTDGSGWIPVNFANGASQLPAMPVDPQNAVAGGMYYSYTAMGGRWKIGSSLESKKYAWKAYDDGGMQPNAYEKGSGLASGIPGSCRAVLESGQGSADGIYWIMPGQAAGAVQAYCDMADTGGGWTLLFQRRGGVDSSETCGANLNSFLRAPCGSSGSLAYGSSYSMDLDSAPKGQEYMFVQYDAAMAADSDDAFIIKSRNELFPDSTAFVQDIAVERICDINNQNCDTADDYFRYVGDKHFGSSLCNGGYGSSFGGNYGYCHNGLANYNSNSLFGNRTMYDETKLWAYTSYSGDAYAERVFVR